MNRRQAIATLAAAPLVAQSRETKIDPEIVRRHDAAVEKALAAQITDAGHRGFGSLPAEDGLYHAGTAAGLFVNYAAAYLHAESKYHRSRVLPERMQMAARFLDRAQHTDGTIDLLTTNFHSTPDTGFVVHSAGTAACLLHRADERGLLAMIEPFLRKAGGALAAGGVHTPNHRWVVSSALAQVNEVFPDARFTRRIDQWLAEGVDIDADGQYTERSTSVYNTVCDRAFTVLAVKLKRLELLEPVRQNLDAMLYLMHPNYEVVTEISRRQDKGERGDIGGYWFPLQYLAVRDRNPVYAGIAAGVAPQRASLPALMEYPEMAGPSPGSKAPPDDYVKDFPVLDVVRFRRGARSATILGNDSLWFALRQGDAVISGVRMAGAFFGKGQLVPPRIERSGKTYTLRQALEAGYYQPAEPPRKVAAGEWGRVRESCKESEICRYEQSAAITETADGFRIQLAAKGTENVPVAIEIGLRAGVEVEGAAALKGRSDAFLLGAGYATVRRGGDRIRVGPGLGQHAYVQVRGAEPKLPGTSLYLTAFAPFEHTLEFVCG